MSKLGRAALEGGLALTATSLNGAVAVAVAKATATAMRIIPHAARSVGRPRMVVSLFLACPIVEGVVHPLVHQGALGLVDHPFDVVAHLARR